jgi:Mn2+/Fe2+ NRAMP family transporter
MRGEKTVKQRQHEANPRALWRMRLDVWTGMFFSNLVMFFIIAACAGTLYASGVTNIETADQAALALKPFGTLAYWLFAAGIVGTGLLAIPVLAGSSAYAFAEAFKWRSGLYRPLKQAHAFYGVIIIAMVLGIGANLLGVDPIEGLIFAAVANAIIAPLVLFFIMRLADDKNLMGRYANGRVTSAVGWLTTLAMALASLTAIWSFL